MSYYKVYYYCDIIDCLLYRFTRIDWAYTGAQFTEPFFQGEVDSFPKYSALHSFCEFAINKLMTEEAEKDIDKIQEKYDELKRFNIQGGDIIVSCRGTIGETYIIPDDAPLGIMHPSIMKIRLKEGIYDKYYFNLLLNSRLNKH